jgi:ABC-type transport system involved in cytochrome bd biosynthesis fused ATPase/permease subunit
MWTLLRYAWSVLPYRVAGALALVSLRAATGVATVLVVAEVVGVLPGAVRGPAGTLLWLIAAMAALLIVNSTLPTLAVSVVRGIGARLDEDLALRLTGPIMTTPGLAHLEDPVVADLWQRARGRIGFAASRGAQAAFLLLTTRASVVGAAALVAVHLSTWPALALAGSTVGAEWAASRIIKQEFDAWHLSTGGYRRSRYLFDLAIREAPKELRVFGLGPFLTGRYRHEWDSAVRPQRAARRKGMRTGLPVMTGHVTVIGGAIALAARASDHGLSPRDLAASVAATVMAGLSYNAVSVAEVARGRDAWRAMARLPEVIAAGVPPAGTERPDPSGWPQAEIRFENVGFRYPGGDHDVLDGLDLRIGAGETVALIGVNGAGKSTVVKLLAGGFRPDQGRITVDGHDLATLSSSVLAGWQRRIAPVMQDSLRLPLSAATNVALDTEADLTALASRADAEPVVAALPNGWDTVLDPTFDGGAALSGGQWQQVALMRALHAVDRGAGLLILDEPAAALDVRAEAALVDHYRDLTRGIATLIISHRYSVVRYASRICVLDGGRIVEQGTHEELLATGGRYADLFRLQAKRYTDAEPTSPGGAGHG